MSRIHRAMCEGCGWTPLGVIVGLLLGIGWCPSLAAQDATVNAGNIHQRMDGFGCEGPIEYGNPTNAQADLFWSPTKGIGLSMLRFNLNADASGNPTLIDQWGDDYTPSVLAAQARGITLHAVTGPPAAWIDSNNYLLSSHYQDYANFITTSLQNMSATGINIAAVSPKNEYNFNIDMHGFILNNLGPTFVANGITTKIDAPEGIGLGDGLTGGWATIFTDPNCAQYVAIFAYHDYGGALPGGTGEGNKYVDPTTVLPLQGKSVWMTEVCGAGYDGSINDGLYWARSIHDNLTIAQASAWTFFFGQSFWDDNGGLWASGDNQGGNIQIPARFWVVGNFSKFVRPGYYRIDATGGPSGVMVSAYQDPNTGNFAIVAINNNTSSTAFNISLSGLSATSVIPWETSAMLQLAQGTAIPVSAGSFSVTLDAQSVTTFVGTGSGASPPLPPVPVPPPNPLPPTPTPPPPGPGPFQPQPGSNYVLTNVNSSLALDVQYSGTATGTPVWQYTPNGTGAQMWQMGSFGDGTYYLMNPNSGLCLGVQNDQSAAGSALVISAPDGSGAHAWTIGAWGNGTYYLVNPNSGLYLGVQNDSTSAGALAVISAPDGSGAHEWTIVDPPGPGSAALAGGGTPSSAASSGGGKGACGLTGLETVLVLGLLAIRRRLR